MLTSQTPMTKRVSGLRRALLRSAMLAMVGSVGLTAGATEARQREDEHKHIPAPAEPAAEASLRQSVSEGDTGAMVMLGLYLGSQSGSDEIVPAETLQLWTRAADAGHPLGAYLVGMTHSRERIESPDPVRARHYLSLAVAGGVRWAAQPYMAMLSQGEGGPVDQAEAERLFPFAAAQYVRQTGDSDHNSIAALREAAHLPEWTQAPLVPAVAGETDHMRLALTLLATGNDAAAREQAQQHLTLAADAGDVNAQVAMAVLLASDHGNPTSISRSFGYARRAAAQGDSDALFQLGATLCACTMEKDRIVRGLTMLDLASQHGSLGALAQYAAMADMVDPQWVTIARQQARECNEQGIEQCGILDVPFPDEKPVPQISNPDMIASARRGIPQTVLKMRGGQPVVVATSAAK